MLDKYINRNVPILHLYKNCGHKVMIAPYNILLGHGCNICKSKKLGKSLLKTHEQYLEDLKTKSIPYKPIEPYINDRTKIKHICPIHDIVFDSCPNYILLGSGCKQCGKDKYIEARRKTHQEYIQELNEKNPNLLALEKYSGANTHILHSCKQNHKFKMTPSVALQGGVCPVCNRTQSKGEKMIEEFLKSHDILYLKQHKYSNLIGINGGLLSYDFYLSHFNLLIEFQGEQHEHPIDHYGGIKRFIKQKIHDTRKRKYCHENNINLLEIWYYEIHITDKILEQYLYNLKSINIETTGVA